MLSIVHSHIQENFDYLGIDLLNTLYLYEDNVKHINY